MTDHIKSTSQSTRLFIAIDMPSQVLEEIDRIQRFFKKLNLCNAAYIKPENIHLTLHFLGLGEDQKIQQIDAALKAIVGQQMQAQLSSLDVFTSVYQLKILYLNIMCPALNTLAQRIETAVAPWSTSKSQPFISHITLARIKTVEDRKKLLREIHQYRTSANNLNI